MTKIEITEPVVIVPIEDWNVLQNFKMALREIIHAEMPSQEAYNIIAELIKKYKLTRDRSDEFKYDINYQA